jgi:hypothetical protein
MWLAYAIALIPIVVGSVFFAFSPKVVWWEWLLAAGAGLILAGVFHTVAIKSMTVDTETWSGRVTEVVHYPEWIEEYEEEHTRTVDDGVDSDGNSQSHTETYTTTEHRTHHESWERHDDFGKIDRTLQIDRGEFDDVSRQFGGQVDVEKPHKSGFDGGDPNVYHVKNRTGVIIPLTIIQTWENRVKAAPSCFSYPKVPESAKVFEWPKNPDTRVSERVMGIARNRFSTLKWDQMNSRLGPSSRVNLIVVGFDSDDSGLGQTQEAKWVGGKKNDLVLCYGCSDRSSKATWTYVFGWTEREEVKKSLQTLLLTSDLNDDLLPRIEAEVAKDYRLKDWSKFDYIRVEPPTWAYLALLGVMIVVQAGVWTWAFLNDAEKFKERFNWKRRGNFY